MRKELNFLWFNGPVSIDDQPTLRMTLGLKLSKRAAINVFVLDVVNDANGVSELLFVVGDYWFEELKRYYLDGFQGKYSFTGKSLTMKRNMGAVRWHAQDGRIQAVGYSTDFPPVVDVDFWNIVKDSLKAWTEEVQIELKRLRHLDYEKFWEERLKKVKK